MRISESHIDIMYEKTRAVLSTVNGSEVYSAFCTIKSYDGEILLDTLDEDQINQIKENEKVSIMVIDPTNMGRWLCIQGTIKLKEIQDPRFSVKIKKIIKFPKEN